MLRGKAKYNIGEVSDICGLSVKTLRYYDKRGILTPSARGETTHYRYYSEEQILEALAIREMKQRGFSLEEIQMIMNTHSFDLITAHYNKKTESIKKEIIQLERKLHLVESSRDMILRAMHDVGQELTPAPGQNTEPHCIGISVMEKTQCLYTRYRSRIFVQEVFWDRFADIYRMIDEKGYTVCSSIMAVFHEHYTHQFFFEEGDLEILQPVTNADPKDPNIKEFGGFLFASLVHVGFYAEFLPKYVALVKWIDDNGYEICGDPLEVYLLEFTQGASKEEYVTRIGFPVKQRESE